VKEGGKGKKGDNETRGKLLLAEGGGQIKEPAVTENRREEKLYNINAS